MTTAVLLQYDNGFQSAENLENLENIIKGVSAGISNFLPSFFRFLPMNGPTAFGLGKVGVGD